MANAISAIAAAAAPITLVDLMPGTYIAESFIFLLPLSAHGFNAIRSLLLRAALLSKGIYAGLSKPQRWRGRGGT
jgi:succinate dehydrogenase/fumarate reductase cytochrome b subunit